MLQTLLCRVSCAAYLLLQASLCCRPSAAGVLCCRPHCSAGSLFLKTSLCCRPHCYRFFVDCSAGSLFCRFLVLQFLCCMCLVLQATCFVSHHKMLVQNSLHNVIQSNDNSTLFKIVLLTKIVLKIHNCSLEFQKCDYHKVGQNVIIPIRA